MYEITAARTNKKAQGLILLFFIGAVALLIVTVPLRGMPFLWIIQLFAILLLVGAVFLVTRYMARSYIYGIDESESGRDLYVVEVSSGGRRRVTVCRVSLSSIGSVSVSDGKDEAWRALRADKRRLFDYRPDIAPERSILISSDEGGERIGILLGYDEKLEKILDNR